MNLIKSQKNWYVCSKTITEVEISVGKRIKINDKEFDYKCKKNIITLLESNKVIGKLEAQDDGTLLLQMNAKNATQELLLY